MPLRSRLTPFTLLTPFTSLIGKSVRAASRLTKHGGSALPGRVIERLDPTFLRRTLDTLPLGVVIVSGTNGKTTTTRMISTMLSKLGLRVFTNPTGSNFTRGVISELLQHVSLTGKLDADIAVLELDEAYAVRFVQQVKPRYAVLLNVLRDQLDRFGEIDNTAAMLGSVAAATTQTVVLNRDDARVRALARLVQPGVDVRFFGVSPELRALFPSDDRMSLTDGSREFGVENEFDTENRYDGDAHPESAAKSDNPIQSDSSIQSDSGTNDDVELVSVGEHRGVFAIDDKHYETPVQLEGVYNLLNAAAGMSIVRIIMRDAQKAGVLRDPHNADTSRVVSTLATVTPAFGRGETLSVNGATVELLLVKNPMGFRLSLASFPAQGHATMIAINDEYADGRDMSWLWDVDFSSLRTTGVAAVAGVRAWDMALRLRYDGVSTGLVTTDIEQGLREFLAAEPHMPKHIYCTYTAMLQIRALLSAITAVPDAGVGSMKGRS